VSYDKFVYAIKRFGYSKSYIQDMALMQAALELGLDLSEIENRGADE
jgi:hypothetical protein